MELEKNEIADLSGYLYRMQKSMIDKMFFIDKIFEPVETIVDFGCANGELIKMLQYYFSEYSYIGYDISDEMIAAAKKNVPNAAFFTDWNDIHVPFDKSLLNISSVIHEVYSYCSPAEIEEFWHRVFDSGFRYITIRDMMLSEAANKPADAADLKKIRSKQAYADKLRDYEQIWGPIVTEKDMVHYLLKYSYTQNWAREVRENYLGLSTERLFRLIPQNYRIVYREHYTLPFIAWQVARDFDIALQTPTHLKIILEHR